MNFNIVVSAFQNYIMSLNIQWVRFIIAYISSHVSQRFIISLFGFLAVINAYSMRICLDASLDRFIVSNTNLKNALQTNHTIISSSESFLPFSLFNRTTFDLRKLDLPIKSKVLEEATMKWSQNMQTIVSSAFYIGYIATQIPGGLIAEKHGSKWILVVCILLSAIFTILTPVSFIYGGPLALIIVRIMIGLCEGPIFPSLNTLLAHWVPARERGKLGVLVLSGTQIGIVFANLTSDIILHCFNWKILFYFFGICGIMWCIGFICLCYNDPSSSPLIQENEKQYLERQICNCSHSNAQLPPTPWRAIFTSAPMWAIISTTIQYEWVQVNIIFYLTNILRENQMLPLNKSLFVMLRAIVPFIVNWVLSIFSGFLSDDLVNRCIISATNVRKVMTAISVVIPIILYGFTSCFICNDNTNFISIIRCALAFIGTYYAGVKLTPLDLSPNYAGTINAIANGFGSLTSLIVPCIRELEAQNPHYKEVCSALWIIGTMLTSGEVQPFNNPNT